MTNVLRRVVVLTTLEIAVLASAGCGSDGQIELTNDTQTDVDVRLGGEEVNEVSSSVLVTRPPRCGPRLRTDLARDPPARPHGDPQSVTGKASGHGG